MEGTKHRPDLPGHNAAEFPKSVTSVYTLPSQLNFKASPKLGVVYTALISALGRLRPYYPHKSWVS